MSVKVSMNVRSPGDITTTLSVDAKVHNTSIVKTLDFKTQGSMEFITLRPLVAFLLH